MVAVMARTAKRLYGPAAQTGSDITAYTAPSGTSLGSSRGAKVTCIIINNTASSAKGAQIAVGTTGTIGNNFLPGGLQIPALSEKVFYPDLPLEAGDAIHVLGTDGTVIITIAGMEFINGS